MKYAVQSIPLKVPLFLLGILAAFGLIWKFYDDFDGMCGNLISELLGIIITIYIVELFLFKRDKESNHKLELIIKGKIKRLVPFTYYWLYRNLINQEPGEEEINCDKVRIEFDKRSSSFTGKDYVRILDALKKLEKYVDDLVFYFDKYSLSPTEYGEVLQLKNIVSEIYPTEYKLFETVDPKQKSRFQEQMINLFNRNFNTILDVVQNLSEYAKTN
jgi:hypothetical protein